MEPARMDSVRKKELGNKETPQVTWRPEELRFRAATNKREEGHIIRTEKEGQGLQEQPEEMGPLKWKKGPFLLSWNKQNEGKKGVLSSADRVSLTMPVGALFSLQRRMTLSQEG